MYFNFHHFTFIIFDSTPAPSFSFNIMTIDYHCDDHQPNHHHHLDDQDHHIMITTATIWTGADPTHLTAAIGDGGNDVSMLQEAHVGLAIIGDHLHHDHLDDGVVE